MSSLQAILQDLHLVLTFRLSCIVQFPIKLDSWNQNECNWYNSYVLCGILVLEKPLKVNHKFIINMTMKNWTERFLSSNTTTIYLAGCDKVAALAAPS